MSLHKTDIGGDRVRPAESYRRVRSDIICKTRTHTQTHAHTPIASLFNAQSGGRVGRPSL